MDVTISIMDYLDTCNASSQEKGDYVHKNIFPIIQKCLNNKENFIIDFSGIDILTTAFCNNAIGKLFYKCDYSDLKKYMSFKGFKNETQYKSLKLSLIISKTMSELDKRE